MRKKTQLLCRTAVSFAVCFLAFAGVAEASDGEDYITIKVNASDENEGLKYAIDSNDPAAFSTQNEFTIPAGTSHTIYVKDAAGNITSQAYSPSGNTAAARTGTPSAGEDDTQQINIDLELGNGSGEDYSNYEYLTDDPVGTGTGTVTGKTTTDGSDSAPKVFYTVTADSGEVFYMVIDQSQSTDNVYLLNAVTLNDLKSLAEDSNPAGTKEGDGEDNLLEALRKSSDDGDSVQDPAETGKKPNPSIGNNIIFLVILVTCGGVFYYLKVYRKKKDEMMDTMDAMDMEEFEAEEEDGDEIEFDEADDEEKERFLNSLVEDEEDNGKAGPDGDEDFYDMDPDEYAGSGKESLTENEPDEDAFRFEDEPEDEEDEEE